jgi:HemY protein
LAELNIAAEDFPAARRALGDLYEVDADARVLTIMAAIERGEGASDTVVKGWLAKAVVAPRGPQWVCDNCHSIHTSWVPVCENCHSFDTLSWTVPSESQMAAPTGVGMLPLIVGALEDKTAEPEADPEEVEDAIESEPVTEDAEILPPEDETAQPKPEDAEPSEEPKETR